VPRRTPSRADIHEHARPAFAGISNGTLLALVSAASNEFERAPRTKRRLFHLYQNEYVGKRPRSLYTAAKV
jgi:hypothetical protein